MAATRRKRRAAVRHPIVHLAARALLIVLVGSVGSVLLLRWIRPVTTAFMIEARVAAVIAGDSHYRSEYRWVAYREISPQLPIAVVAAEDQKFPIHAGFDFDAIADALGDRGDGGPSRGASTITQQVAKNLFLWPGHSFVRKALEAWFTILIETLWPKERILEVYLNVAQFGDGIYGVQAAAQRFWHKPALRLSSAEAASLAAVLPNPLRLHADRPSPYLIERREWILGQMGDLGGASYLRALENERRGAR